MTYSEKLRDPRWQRKRLEVMKRDKWTCLHCHSKDRTLNVHHVNYERGKAPWEYEGNALITLCESCHSQSENAIHSIRNFLAWGERDDVEELRQQFNAIHERRREVLKNA